MGTVASQLTRIHDVEGGLTTVAIGGGPGAAANADIFLQGAQSVGRRVSNATIAGYLLDDGGSNDLSAAGVHVGAWVWVTHYAVLTALRLRIASNDSSANFDEHTVPLTEYPRLGGWIRVWVDISRTPDFTGGTALDEATARYFGLAVSIPTVGGNVANVILDAIDHTTTGLLLTGTAGLWSDFTTADENTTNQYGVLRNIGGVFNCFARLLLGSSSSLVFSDANFAIIFAQQNLVNATFMGITCDLQHASTDITWANGNVKSAGAKKGDIVVTGTSGALLASGCVFDGMRIITLTAACELNGCIVQNSGLVTQAGAVLDTCRVAGQTGAVALLAADPAAISDSTFTSPGTGHALELTTPGTYTFTGNVFSGYAGTDGSTGNEAVYNNSGGLVTLNIVGGGSTPSVRNGSGASTVVNSNVSVTLTGLKNPSEVRVFAEGTTTEIAGQENVTTGSFAFGVASGVAVDIAILALGYQNMRILNYSTTADATLPISQQVDRQYLNP